MIQILVGVYFLACRWLLSHCFLTWHIMERERGKEGETERRREMEKEGGRDKERGKEGERGRERGR